LVITLGSVWDMAFLLAPPTGTRGSYVVLLTHYVSSVSGHCN
jgi:hypothetical protein